MSEATFENFSDFVKQSVRSFTTDKTWFENKAPLHTAFQKMVEKVPITQKGFQMPYISRRPGGHTAYLPSNSSFNRVVSPESQSMYIFPTRYALPMVFQGALISALKAGSQEKLLEYNEMMRQYMDAAMKRLEYMAAGDGSGVLAVSSSNLTVPGAGQTMNCTTTAAATAGQTKGALRLEEGHSYQAINTSAGTVRGGITVETEGTSSCVVTLDYGAVSANDYLVDIGAYMRYRRGLAHLISKTSRILQALSTATFRDLNSPEVDLNGQLCTPADFEDLKTYLQTRNNEETAENQLMAFLTFGFYSRLKKQGWNLTIQDAQETRGVAKRFVDGDTVFTRTADMDEDRCYLARPEAIKEFEEKPMDDIALDAQELRMLMGENGTGSDDWQKAIGCAGNPGIVLPRACAYIKRAQFSGGVTQVSSF